MLARLLLFCNGHSNPGRSRNTKHLRMYFRLPFHKTHTPHTPHVIVLNNRTRSRHCSLTIYKTQYQPMTRPCSVLSTGNVRCVRCESYGRAALTAHEPTYIDSIGGISGVFSYKRITHLNTPNHRPLYATRENTYKV